MLSKERIKNIAFITAASSGVHPLMEKAIKDLLSEREQLMKVVEAARAVDEHDDISTIPFSQAAKADILARKAALKEALKQLKEGK